MNNLKDLKEEFKQLCYDDDSFNYNENEFKQWLRDYNIEVEE